ncbi:NUDIX domain-containing protein [Clostridium sp. D2Q-11]|uniref:NUDIX domain-containing protein n=1 Tax=Anaeromonas frigoriresistens TaxID=2683708 RepID=A0A942UX18_9FIRM|nr:NUDIX domain-containing protein [Anaeromonas frigoriresistens]MBS4540163.1 NUDIX domain-containing protein [Anaeromonas frigoriresistens]
MFKILTKSIIVKDKEILILKRSENSSFGGKLWDIPGGKLEFGETLKESIIREIKEETNIDINIKKTIASTSSINKSNDKQFITLIYLCEYHSGDIKLDDEHIDYKWIKPKDALNLPMVYYAIEGVKAILEECKHGHK